MNVLGGLLGGLTIVLCYWLSLRRGPYARLFFLVGVASLIGLVAATFGAAASAHVDLAGLMGIGLAVAAPMMIMTFVNEMDASMERGSATNRWRLAEAKRNQPTIKQPWLVESVVCEDDSQVKVQIRRGEFSRIIGMTDPILEPDAYQVLLVQAQSHAGIYESLGIVSESKALVEYDANAQRWR